MKIIFTFTLIVILFVGCSVNSNLNKQIYEKERIFNSDFNEVWESTIECLMISDKWFIIKVEKDAGFINLKESPSYNFNPYTSDNNLVLLPNGYAAGFCFIKVNSNIYVSKLNNNSVKITVNTFPQLYENVFYNNWVMAKSTGLIEKNILDEIEKVLSKKMIRKELENGKSN